MTLTENRIWKPVLLIAAIVAATFAFLMVGWILVSHYVHPSTPKEHTDAIGLMAQILGGAVLLREA